MALTVENRIRILELAISLGRGDTSSNIVDNATKFAEFVEADAAKAPRKTKPAAEAPVVAVVEETKPAAPVAEPVKEVAKPVAPVVAETPKAAPVASSVVTEADVKALVGKLATNPAAGGAPKAREILSQCGGATNISTLKPEYYTRAKALIEATLEQAAVAA